MLRVRMSWEEVEGGVFLEETQGLGLIPHPTVTLPTWLRALYPHKMFHPRAPNPPLEPSGVTHTQGFAWCRTKGSFFPFLYLFWELSTAQERFPGNFLTPAASLMSPLIFQEVPQRANPSREELYQPCLTLIHPCGSPRSLLPALPHFQAEQRGILGPGSVLKLPSVEAAHIFSCSSFLL